MAYGANCRLQKSDVGPMSQIAGYFSSDSGVYPNPVKDVLNIKHEGDFGVRIFDFSGRLVLSMENTRMIGVKVFDCWGLCDQTHDSRQHTGRTLHQALILLRIASKRRKCQNEKFRHFLFPLEVRK